MLKKELLQSDFNQSLKITYNFPTESFEDDNTKPYLMSFLANLNSAGLTLSKNAIEQMSKLSSIEIKNLNDIYMPAIRQMKGFNDYQFFYPNFPQEAMEKSDAERFYDQIIHYAGTYIFIDPSNSDNIAFLPNSEKEERMPLVEENKDLIIIDVQTEKEYYESMMKLIASPVSLPAHQIERINNYFDMADKKEVFKNLPNSIPNKENLAQISTIIAKHAHNPEDVLGKYYKTATDVLRYATSISGGDVSLVENTKFKNFTRQERRMLLGLLDKCNNLLEDINRNSERFKRLSERLHPGEYADKYPRIFHAMQKIHEGDKIRSFNSKVNKLFVNQEFDQLFELLKNRPGVFAENINRIISTYPDQFDRTVAEFSEVAPKVSVSKLLSIGTYFKYNRDNEFRSVTPKGKGRFLIPNEQQKLSTEQREKMAAICHNALTEKFKNLPAMGKVYVDASIEGYTVPMQLREQNQSIGTLAEGSRIKADTEKNYIRPFIGWSNQKDGNVIDVDLSTSFCNENFEPMGHCSYTRLKNEDFAIHSGDIVNGGSPDASSYILRKGLKDQGEQKEGNHRAAEAIDINKEKMKEAGVRYMVTTVHNYSGFNFKNMDNCHFGFMERENPEMGEIIEPSMIKNFTALKSNATTVCPIIYDVVKDEFIWVDRALNQQRVGANIENSIGGVAAELYTATQYTKPQLSELIEDHIKARGEKTEDIEEADIVFTLKRDERFDNCKEDVTVITPYDLDTILSEYMTEQEIVPEEVKENIKENTSLDKREKDDEVRSEKDIVNERINNINALLHGNGLRNVEER